MTKATYPKYPKISIAPKYHFKEALIKSLSDFI